MSSSSFDGDGGSCVRGQWLAAAGLVVGAGSSVEPRIVPFRGDYWVRRPAARHLANALLYPVPDPGFPFLGIHTTPRMDGSMWLGPNAVLASAREGYGRYDVRLRDLGETLRRPVSARWLGDIGARGPQSWQAITAGASSFAPRAS